MTRLFLALVCLLAVVPPGMAGGYAKGSSVANTAQNDRDLAGETLTACDQSNAPADVDLTRKIRKAVMADGSLSMTAKNIKIITISGKVTLRGPVKNADEKTAIDKLAKSIAGAANVDDQLESEKS